MTIIWGRLGYRSIFVERSSMLRGMFHPIIVLFTPTFLPIQLYITGTYTILCAFKSITVYSLSSFIRNRNRNQEREAAQRLLCHQLKICACIVVGFLFIKSRCSLMEINCTTVKFEKKTYVCRTSSRSINGLLVCYLDIS